MALRSIARLPLPWRGPLSPARSWRPPATRLCLSLARHYSRPATETVSTGLPSPSSPTSGPVSDKSGPSPHVQLHLSLNPFKSFKNLIAQVGGVSRRRLIRRGCGPSAVAQLEVDRGSTADSRALGLDVPSVILSYAGLLVANCISHCCFSGSFFFSLPLALCPFGVHRNSSRTIHRHCSSPFISSTSSSHLDAFR
jgi:hypothetical protein